MSNSHERVRLDKLELFDLVHDSRLPCARKTSPSRTMRKGSDLEEHRIFAHLVTSTRPEALDVSGAREHPPVST